jgi:hypothetical protein
VAKFQEPVQEVYMENKGSTSKGNPIMDPKQWIVELYNYGVMNLLEIPLFDRGNDVNACETNFGARTWRDFRDGQTCPD